MTATFGDEDVSVYRNIPKLGKVKLYGNLKRLQMEVKTAECIMAKSTHCFYFILDDIMQIYTAKFYTQTTNLSPE